MGELITLKTFEDMANYLLDEMEDFLEMTDFEEEFTKYSIVHYMYDDFKSQLKELVELVNKQGITQYELEEIVNNLSRMIDMYFETIQKEEEELEETILSRLEMKVTRHKKYTAIFHAITKEIKSGNIDMKKLIKVVYKYAPEFNELEANFAVSYIGEEIGFDMNNFINNNFFASNPMD